MWNSEKCESACRLVGAFSVIVKTDCETGGSPASTVSNYMPAAGHRKIMRRESQKVGLCSAQVISQPEHFTQLNPGAIVHNLSLYLARHPPLSVPSTAFILVNLEHFYTTFQNTAVKFRIHVSEWIGSRSLFVIHDVSVSRFSIKFNLQSNSRHVSDRVTSVQDFGKMYQSSNFLIWPLLCWALWLRAAI